MAHYAPLSHPKTGKTGWFNNEETPIKNYGVQRGDDMIKIPGFPLGRGNATVCFFFYGFATV